VYLRKLLCVAQSISWDSVPKKVLCVAQSISWDSVPKKVLLSSSYVGGSVVCSMAGGQGYIKSNAVSNRYSDICWVLISTTVVSVNSKVQVTYWYWNTRRICITCYHSVPSLWQVWYFISNQAFKHSDPLRCSPDSHSQSVSRSVGIKLLASFPLCQPHIALPLLLDWYLLTVLDYS